MRGSKATGTKLGATTFMLRSLTGDVASAAAVEGGGFGSHQGIPSADVKPDRPTRWRKGVGIQHSPSVCEDDIGHEG